MVSVVTITSDARATILGASAAAPDREACGLLFGTGQAITKAAACRNIADDPATRFEIDPAALLAGHRAARQGGAAILGCFHSHPNGSTMPSPRDAADAAADGSLWLIAAADRIGAWRAVPDGALHGRFDPVTLHCDDGAATTRAITEETR